MLQTSAWCLQRLIIIGPNKISVFRVTGPKILGKVGTHVFFLEKYNFMHFERHFALQNT